MSFERQFCEKCNKLSFCVDTSSLEHTFTKQPKQKWLCDYCFSWLIGNAEKKDEIRQIMIECGIEDLDTNA